MKHKQARSRWVWWIIACLCCLLLFFVFYKAARLARAVQLAYRNSANFGELVKGGNLDAPRFALAQSFLRDAARATAEADQEMHFFQPLLLHLGWLPFYGPTLAALPPVLKVGHGLADLAVQGLVVAQPLLVTPAGTTGETPPLIRLAKVLHASKPQLANLAQQTAVLQQTLAGLSPDNLLTALADPVANLQAGVALLASGLQVSDDLPELLGAEKEQNYLILVQNNHELRGTGGFVTSIGTLTLYQGKVINVAFVDSYAVGQVEGPQPSAPPPMQRYMNIDALLLRDVNWSPDLPTTAQIARSLYAQQTGRMVDGVITIDLHAVELLVGALEPLLIPGNQTPITGANVVTQIKQMWTAPLPDGAMDVATSDTNQGDATTQGWWKNRKNFIPQMATVALARLQTGAFDYTSMMNALYMALDERAIQIWSANPAIATKLAELHWDGGLHPTLSDDFLALVDTNMGYNKVDAVLQRTLAYQVDWPDGPDKPAQALAVVTYQHPLALVNYDCDPRPHYGQTYDDMITRCYFDYVRLFVPAGSQLVGIEGVEPDSVNSQRGEAGTEFFAGHFSVKPGEQKTIIFRYRLPVFVKPVGYRLVMQKQAGAQPLPFSANVAGAAMATTLQSGRFAWQPTAGN